MSTSAPRADLRGGDNVALHRLAAEQAALRRVATLVAGEATPAKVFAAVAEEVARLIPADGSALTRYEPDGTVTALGGWTAGGGYRYVGTTYQLEGTVSGRVLETGGPARVDDYADAPGQAPDAAREMGWRSSVGAPITVGGRLWGVLAVVAKSEQPLPPDTERRLVAFTELVATAIANAEGREKLTTLAGEQAALRRVATLVAAGAAPHEVFAAVGDEVARTLGFPSAGMLRFEADESVTMLATAGSEVLPMRTRLPREDQVLATSVLAAGGPARVDYTKASGRAAEAVRAQGLHWGVGAPIIVDGTVWGVMGLGSTEPEPPPAETEGRLVKFTELLATAIANAESREALAQLAEEQAALRRVATLVAEGAQPDRVFAAVADEVAAMFGVPIATMLRFDSDGFATLLATAGARYSAVGARFLIDESWLLKKVFETGDTAHIEDWADVPGPGAGLAREAGIWWSVGVPIVVEGALWGTVVVSSRDAGSFEADLEPRLAKFTELLATAIANAEGRAEVDASRARIVAAADATRRRIERDLHDGAQQQLVWLALALRAAQATVPEELEQHRNELGRVIEGLRGALDDLREVALGIHPAGLSEDGLTPALRRLVARSPLRVDLDVRADGRFPEPVEVTAYYVVSEALTNAAKYAHAPVVEVAVTAEGGTFHVEVRDGGCGGADPAGGSGLVGLRDRVEAIGGTMRLTSPPGAGTSLRVELPLVEESRRG